MFFVYIIECRNRHGKISYYIGYTNAPKRRLGEHLAGKGAKYVKGKVILRMIIYHEYHTIKQAMNGELEAKKLSPWRKKMIIGIAFGSSLDALRIPKHGLAKCSYPFWYLDESNGEGHYAFSDEFILDGLLHE